jgi:hypothetical protein
MSPVHIVSRRQSPLLNVAPARKLCDPTTYDAAPMKVRSTEK